MTRRALVTGNAHGIGLAIARALSEVGHEVLGVDVASDAPTGTLRYDLGSWAACQQLVTAVGDIDVLVNNAAVLIEEHVADVSEDSFATTMAVNLRAPLLLTRGFAQGMCSRGFGRVVNVASIGARTGGVSDSAVYAASKAGLVSMTKHFARLYAAFGVTVNAINPGAIDAPMAKRQIQRDRGFGDRALAAVPTGRWGDPREVAAVAAFLASESAGFVTGATVDVNGGWLMA